jgi:cytochrome-b5 reductase
VLSQPSDSWAGPKGHVDRTLLAAALPPPQEGAATKVFVCGPPGFMKTLSGEKKSASDQGELAGLLKDMRYTPEQVFKF